jgi:predicted house-cleaning noncanonical NTP pyrophosphatase (MazG superfamily)
MLTQQERVGHLTIHGSSPVSVPRGGTAPAHYRKRRSVVGETRDKIPDVIRASGRTPLTGDEYRGALNDKLREEVTELLTAQTSSAVVEEAADILEVVTAIAGEHGATRAGR